METKDLKKIKIMKTQLKNYLENRKIRRQVKKIIKKNCYKNYLIKIYERWCDPPSWHLEWLYSKNFNFLIDFFIKECEAVNNNPIDVIIRYMQ